MRNDKLSIESMDFAISIINLVKHLKEQRESIISNQIGRSGTSIGANIREAQYAHSKGKRKMKRSIKSEIHLITTSGKTLVPVEINYDDDENLTHPLSEISVIYNSNNYTGKGTDYLWVDTFADLQVKLPQNVKIACCMTCRHGNMCPYGNRENELFCTKDILIHNKNDMLNLFDESEPFSERKVSSLDFCDNFVYQNNEHYTYNDYLFHLQDMQNN